MHIARESTVTLSERFTAHAVALPWRFALAALLQVCLLVWCEVKFERPFDWSSTLAIAAARVVAVASILYGVRLYRPANHLVWWILGLRFGWSIFFSPIRNLLHGMVVLWQIDAAVGTLTYCLVAGILVARRATSKDRTLWIDVAVVSIGMLFALLSCFGLPTPTAHGYSFESMLLGVVYPCIDTVLIALCLMLEFTTVRARNGSLQLLLAAFTVVFLADISILMSYLKIITVAQSRAFVPASLSFIGLIGLAALLPSMQRIDETLTNVPKSWDLPRLMLIVGAFLLTIYRSLTWTTRGARPSPVFEGLVFAVMFLLIVIRAYLAIRAMDASHMHVEYVATHDTATNLLNRNGLSEMLSSTPKSARENSLILLRFGELREVGEMWGHEVREHLIADSATAFKSAVGADGSLARIGSSRFALLMENSRGQIDHVEQVAAKLANAAHQIPAFAKSGIMPVFDIGITHGHRTNDLEELLREAESAAIVAQSRGRGCTAFFDAAVSAREKRRYALINMLRGAVERNELKLLYQPVVDLVTRKEVSYEALLRWSTPELGPIAPDEFIPLAESSDAIESITDWVLDTACRNAVSTSAMEYSRPGYRIAVNISSRSLSAPGLTQRVSDALKRHDLPTTALCLELTERSMLDDPYGELHALQATGVSLAIDDFGTGYSNLATLTQFNANAVKLDMSLVSAMGADDTLRGVISSVLRPLRERGVKLIAEGIETQEQCAMVVNLGCEFGQGWLFGKPRAHLQESSQIPG
jgi:diguanylate cyclase